MKDRAAPFSRKHRRTWMPVVIGMAIIGAINLALGIWLYLRTPPDAPRPPPGRPAWQSGAPAGEWSRDAAVPAPDASSAAP